MRKLRRKDTHVECCSRYFCIPYLSASLSAPCQLHLHVLSLSWELFGMCWIDNLTEYRSIWLGSVLPKRMLLVMVSRVKTIDPLN